MSESLISFKVENTEKLLPFSVSSMINRPVDLSGMPLTPTPVDEEKQTRKKKKNIGGVMVTTNEDEDKNFIQTNAAYKESYAETDHMLRTAIAQIDKVSSDIMTDVDFIRASKVMKGKYTYLGEMNSTLGSLIGTKISAARELNNTIGKCHDLELKRTKELKLNENAVDDTRAVMDTFNSFVSMPTSSAPVTGYNSPLGPTTMDFTLSNNSMISRAIGADPEAGYKNYLNNMSPEQRLMTVEGNPNIVEVVVYNRDTYQKSFEMMDMASGQILSGLPKKNTAMYMPETTIDLVNNVARNITLGQTWPIVQIGTGFSGDI